MFGIYGIRTTIHKKLIFPFQRARSLLCLIMYIYSTTMRTAVVLLLLLLSAVVYSCDEAANVWLPDKTSEGMNTLGFITDDHVWMNYGVRCTDAGCKEN